MSPDHRGIRIRNTHEDHVPPFSSRDRLIASDTDERRGIRYEEEVHGKCFTRKRAAGGATRRLTECPVRVSSSPSAASRPPDSSVVLLTADPVTQLDEQPLGAMPPPLPASEGMSNNNNNPQQQRQAQFQRQEQPQQQPQQSQPAAGGQVVQQQQPAAGTQQQQYSIPGILHYLQYEWQRFEVERQQWTVERAELQARICLLQGETGLCAM